MRSVKSLIQDRRNLFIIVPMVILLVCLLAIYWTRDSMANLQFLRQHGGQSDLVDQRPWQTVEALAPLAVSAEEQRYATEGERLADHEVDQAFAMALRQASLETPVLKGEALGLSRKVQELQQVVKDDQARVDGLTNAVKGPNGASLADDLDVAKAQLALDTDVLSDANDDLAIMSGDKRSKIQQELAAHEAGMHAHDQHANTGGQTAVVSARRYGTLYGRIQAWLNQSSRYKLIVQAKQQADSDAAALSSQYAKLRAEVGAGTSLEIDGAASSSAPGDSAPQSIQAPSSSPAVGAGLSKSARLAQIKKLSAQSNILGILGDRWQTQKQLSAVYGKWADQVQLQHRIVGHLALQSFAWIAFIVFCSAVVASTIRAVLERPTMDQRRKRTLRTILMLATQVITLLLILLVFFGPPNQFPTILGLATAGLTVALQDFIIAFLGWFVLMGKNGIRVDDWVEINGVGGEVVEIGLFRTSLLETGNWTDKGHPTGRRVTFLNKFAIAGQYFNFSTNGQWMWDEIRVNIPAADNNYEMIEQIHKAVLKETENDATLAAQEWERVTRQSNLSQFSAAPSVDMRPAANGIDIVVRYVTRAAGRFEMRNRLYQTVITLMRGPQPQLAAVAPDVRERQPVLPAKE
jgi:small-conductance mechanosensitive channel